MKTKYVCLVAVVLNFISLSRARADSAFDYVDTPEFTTAAQGYYLSHVASDTQRQKIIDTAKEDCGGRYEGVDLKITELSHEIVLDKRYIRTPNPKNYQLAIDARAEDSFIVIESIRCSVVGGNYMSVLHSQIVKGVEERTITYTYKNDHQQGKPALAKPVHTFTDGPTQFTDLYRAPYGGE